jgi:hypothetical protein
MSDTFFETVPGQPHTTVHSRVWDHPGAVVDLGCRGWDWSAPFIGRKRVIGCDPDPRATAIPGTELMQTQIGAYDGIVAFQGETFIDAPAGGPQSAIWSWKRFAKAAIDIKGIAILKINIEAGEYPLLASLDERDFAAIDQLAISFHHFAWAGKIKATRALVGYLEDIGYKSRSIYEPLGWYLFY